jgi:hypothetical protein
MQEMESDITRLREFVETHSDLIDEETVGMLVASTQTYVEFKELIDNFALRTKNILGRPVNQLEERIAAQG